MYVGESFYHEWMLNFVKCLSMSIEMIMYLSALCKYHATPVWPVGL